MIVAVFIMVLFGLCMWVVWEDLTELIHEEADQADQEQAA